MLKAENLEQGKIELNKNYNLSIYVNVQDSERYVDLEIIYIIHYVTSPF